MGRLQYQFQRMALFLFCLDPDGILTQGLPMRVGYRLGTESPDCNPIWHHNCPLGTSLITSGWGIYSRKEMNSIPHIVLCHWIEGAS